DAAGADGSGSEELARRDRAGLGRGGRRSRGDDPAGHALGARRQQPLDERDRRRGRGEGSDRSGRQADEAEGATPSQEEAKGPAMKGAFVKTPVRIAIAVLMLAFFGVSSQLARSQNGPMPFAEIAQVLQSPRCMNC